MPTLPREADLYRALVRRDASWAGLFFFGVKTTGVFCAHPCPAPTPRRENVVFFASASDAEHAGFRACRRCRPLDPPDAKPRWVERLLGDVETRSRTGRPRMSDDDVRRAGFDPVSTRRYFKERFGMTFHAYQRTLWLADAPGTLATGRSPTEVALESGFDSESGFRAAFTRLFGTTPGRMRVGSTIRAAWLTTPLGGMMAAARSDRVCFLEFVDRAAIADQTKSLRRWFAGPVLPGTNVVLEQLRAELAEYFAGERRRFDVPIALAGTPFQESVWNALLAIPYGETRSYADIARAIGSPRAVRAVGKANGDNRLAILIPCHRVVEKSGALRGYAGGLWRKQRLLDLERGHTTPHDRTRVG